MRQNETGQQRGGHGSGERSKLVASDGQPNKINSQLGLPSSLKCLVSLAEIDFGRRVILLNYRPAPHEFEGLEAALATYERAMRPATAEERGLIFGELAAVFPFADADAGAERVRWGAYHKALEDIPADLLRGACDDLIRTSIFPPKPAEIRAAAQKGLAERIKTFSRLRALKTMRIEVRGSGREEPTAEMKARVRRLLSTIARPDTSAQEAPPTTEVVGSHRAFK